MSLVSRVQALHLFPSTVAEDLLKLIDDQQKRFILEALFSLTIHLNEC
jgi:hypothetical protein